MKNIKNRRNIKNYGTESELPFIFTISIPYDKVYYAWIVTYNFSINILLYTIFVVSCS
jgi:hypothetical protein